MSLSDNVKWMFLVFTFLIDLISRYIAISCVIDNVDKQKSKFLLFSVKYHSIRSLFPQCKIWFWNFIDCDNIPLSCSYNKIKVF